MNSNQKETLSRRSLLKTTTAAAFGVALPASLAAIPGGKGVYYGSDAAKGQKPLDNTNIFPLLTAWIMLTTSGKNMVDAALIAKTANMDKDDNVKALLDKYNDQRFASSFQAVQVAFSEIAKGFSTANSPYHGGQCPDSANTIAPIASMPCVAVKAKS